MILLPLLCILATLSSAEALDQPLVFTQEPLQPTTTQDGWAFRKSPVEGCRIVRLDPDGSLNVLTSEFASAAHPCVSFDGQHILFAAKPKAGSSGHWDIWQMRADGSEKRRITDDIDGDCWDPIYMARGSITPPEFTDKVRWISFVSTAPNSYDLHGSERATALYASNVDPIEGRGTLTWRTTFNLSSDFSPTMLSDGRVLFSSWQYYGERYAPYGKVALLTINWAGTGLNVFYGNHEGARMQTMAAEMPDRTVVFIESDGSTVDGSGDLARVSFRRPLHSRERLAKGRFRHPHPTPDGGILVAHAPNGEQYGLIHFDPRERRITSTIYDDPDWNDIDAQILAPRPEPQGRITIVVDSKDTGHLQCLNVYDSDQPEAASIRPGDVKQVRFLEGLPPEAPQGSTANPFPPVRILGEAPVETDGSFYVHLPADTPLSIQLLDTDGIALQTMQGWMWVRRGSRRGCIGCHENKELAPENRVTQALLKANPHELLAPPEARRQVLFERDILPIIEANCQRCHTGPAAEDGFHLESEVAYTNLLSRTGVGEWKYVRPGEARNSPLIQYTHGERMPPHAPLAEEQRRLLATWVDTGAR